MMSRRLRVRVYIVLHACTLAHYLPSEFPSPLHLRLVWMAHKVKTTTCSLVCVSMYGLLCRFWLAIASLGKKEEPSLMPAPVHLLLVESLEELSTPVALAAQGVLDRSSFSTLPLVLVLVGLSGKAPRRYVLAKIQNLKPRKFPSACVYVCYCCDEQEFTE